MEYLLSTNRLWIAFRAVFLSRKTFPALLVLAVAIAFILAEVPWRKISSFEKLRANHATSETLFQDRHGRNLHILRTDFHERSLSWVPLDKISPALITSLLNGEDKAFFRHEGVDWIAAIRSAIMAISDKRAPHGASTITMQLASHLDPALSAGHGKYRRSVFQKALQVLAAWSLEIRWSKYEILEAYFNFVSFRGELRGIEAAARGLFGKRPSGLNIDEAVLLVALIRSPNASLKLVVQRACLLLGKMLTVSDCSEIRASAKRVLQSPYILRREFSDAPHAVRRIISQTKYNKSENPIRTTIDRNIQRHSLRSVRRHLLELRGKNVEDAAVLVADNKTGEILSYIGSSGSLSNAPFVDGISARRQAGSTLKPFIYGMALEERLLTASTLIWDAPLEIKVSIGGVYQPKNYDNVFHGSVSVREALAASLNTPAVRTIQRVGPARVVARLEALGFSGLEQPDFYGASLALGSADVALWDMVNAYRSLANGGMKNSLKLRPIPNEKTNQVMDPRVAFIITSILADRESRSRTFGFESPLATPFFSAVKTGTSKDMRDNWCIGFSELYTVGVWVGNFSGEPMWNVSGISGAGPIWRDIMDFLHSRKGSVFPAAPPGIVSRYINIAKSGHTYQEFYLDGTAPTTEYELVAPKPVSARPGISYPTDGAIFAVDPDVPKSFERLSFVATNISKDHGWQLNGKYIGPADAPLLWKPTIGKYALTLVSESGEIVANVRFTVR